MFRFQKKKCTHQCVGMITKKRWNGRVWFVTAAYRVNGIDYQRTEQVTYHSTNIHKVGAIPVGTHWKIALDSIDEGVSVNVNYNPAKPKQSYFPDNNGRHIV